VDTKQQMLKAIEELPDDASVEDALERLYLLYKIVRATRQWELQTISALNAIVPLQRGTVDAKRRQGYGQKIYPPSSISNIAPRQSSQLCSRL